MSIGNEPGLPSDKLIPPLNAPGAPRTSPGIQPGTTGVFLAQYVIVFGTSGGVFIYAGTPGPGNPPVYWMGNVTADPYGNPLKQGIWAGQPGNIQVGIQAQGGIAEIFFVPAGTYNDDATAGMVQSGGQAILELRGAQTTANPTPQSDRTILLLWDHGGGTSAALQGTYVDANGGLSDFFNGRFNGLELPGVATFAAVLPGSGTSSSAPFQSETWHQITLDSGWSGVVGYDLPQYRLLPGGAIELSGCAQFSGTPGNPQHLNNSHPIPSDYWPASGHYYRSGDSHRMGVQMNTNGVIDCYPVTGGVNQASLDGMVSLT